jgi:hypothetical protein
MALHINEWQSVSEGVHWQLSYLSILSEHTAWFLTLTKALIGDQLKYSLLAGLWLVIFHGLLHYVDQIKKFGSPLRHYFGGWLFGIILEGQAQETKQENQWAPAQSATWHLILICSQWSRQFGLARQILFPMEYAPVFCGTNLLFLDEIQVNGEGGDSNTEMMLFSDICSNNDDSEVVGEANSDHPVGEYSARCSKGGKVNVFFKFPRKANFIFCWA